MTKSEIVLLAILAAAPRKLAAGINVWTSHGPGGGPVQAAVIDPKNPSTLYVVGAAYGAGQVFKSTDGGASWNSASSGIEAGVGVIGLAVDPKNPSTLYAWGNGPMFKSTNGAQNWIAASPPGGASSLALDPQNPSTLYAGGSGVYKSTDGGKTWSAASSGLPGGGVRVLAVDPQNPKTVYVWLGDFPRGIFKSTDGGATWNAPLKERLIELSKSSTGTCDDWGYYFAQATGRDAPAPEDISCLPPGGSRDQLITADQYVTDLQAYVWHHFGSNARSVGLIFIATTLIVDPQNPASLYGVSEAGMVKSTDGGASWNVANSGLPIYYGNRIGLAIDPTNSTVLYAGTGRELFKSTDGALSWNAAGSGLPSIGAVGAVVLDPQHPGTVYAAGDFGVFKSTDGTGSWSPANSGLVLSTVVALAVDPQNRGTIFAGTCCGAAGVSKSTDGGKTWRDTGLAAGFVGSLALDPQNPATVYASIANPNGVYKSTDRGVTWTSTGMTQFVGRLTIDPQNPGTVYAASGLANGGILKSVDGGATWSAVSSGLTANAGNNFFISFLALDPQNPATLYAGRGDTNQVFKTTNGGGNWSAVNLGWDVTLFHSFAAVDPQNPGTLYAGTTELACGDLDNCPADYSDKVAAAGGPGLFKSTDGGNSWMKLDALDATSAGGVYTLAIDPKNPGTLYAALGYGYYSGGPVLRSTDGGASWSALSSAGLTAPVNSLAVDPQDPSTVYAATSGTGVSAITLASQ